MSYGGRRVAENRNDLFHSKTGLAATYQHEDETDSFLENQLQTKETRIQEQDAIMEQLHDSVRRFGEQTNDMRNEIEDHMGLITSMQADLDENQNTLDLINDKALTLIEKSGGECRVICILSVVSFILFLLVLYT